MENTLITVNGRMVFVKYEIIEGRAKIELYNMDSELITWGGFFTTTEIPYKYIVEYAEHLANGLKGGNEVEDIRSKMMREVTIEDLAEMTREVNAWDGALEHLEVYEMDEFDDIMHGFESSEIAMKIQYGAFDINDYYFGFDGYANLISYTERDYHEMLEDEKDYIIELALDLYENEEIYIEHILERYED